MKHFVIFLVFVFFLNLWPNICLQAQGREVSRYNTDWKFMLADNPEFSDYASKNSCRAFEGRMIAIIKATENQGIIILRASAKGLTPGEISFSINNLVSDIVK
jgi:hypothetical protein